MSDYYLLRDGEVVPTDLMTWAKEFDRDTRVVQQNRYPNDKGDDEILVSTVFLGLDHSFCGGRPLLFETMVFGGEHDQHQVRYSTLDEAKAGHLETCAMVTRSRVK